MRRRFPVAPGLRWLWARSTRELPVVKYDPAFAAWQREHDPKVVLARRLRELRASLR